jgi:hypothetical protein
MLGVPWMFSTRKTFVVRVFPYLGAMAPRTRCSPWRSSGWSPGVAESGVPWHHTARTPPWWCFVPNTSQSCATSPVGFGTKPTHTTKHFCSCVRQAKIRILLQWRAAPSGRKSLCVVDFARGCKRAVCFTLRPTLPTAYQAGFPRVVLENHTHRITVCESAKNGMLVYLFY